VNESWRVMWEVEFAGGWWIMGAERRQQKGLLVFM
jgi:hypothetical protein